MVNILKALMGIRENESGLSDKSTVADKPDLKPSSAKSQSRLAVAVAVLCLEMAEADEQFSEVEHEQISAILKQMFQLADAEIADILKSAQAEIDKSLDLWQFTHVINENFDKDHKKEVIRAIWQLVYADGTLDKFEDYLMHKLSSLLNLTHSDLIEAKLKVLAERS